MARKSASGDVGLIASAACIGEGEPELASLADALAAVSPGSSRLRMRPAEPVVFSDGRVHVGGSSAPLEVPDPAEAWEAMEARGLVPLGWASGDGFRFLDASSQRHDAEGSFAWVVGRGGRGGDVAVSFGLTRSSDQSASRFDWQPAEGDLAAFRSTHSGSSSNTFRRGMWAAPQTIEQAVSLAADSANAQRALSLASEAMRRLRPWMSNLRGYPPLSVGYSAASIREPFGWRCRWSDVNAGAISVCSGAVTTAVFSADRRAYKSIVTEARRLASRAPAYSQLPLALRDLLCWRRLAASGAEVVQPASSVYVAGGLLGRKFGELDCPFEPLLDLWGMGYCLHDTLGPNGWVMAPPLSVPR